MATILEFPSTERQGLNYLESQLQEMLLKKGADAELVDYAVATVKDTYLRATAGENYSFSLSLPEGVSEPEAASLQDNIQQALNSIRSENHAVVIRLVAELALAQLTIFQQQRVLRGE